ncbi:MBL fold metallo-hydrolase [Algimonas porphyrae]|uniref:MBL fold metallo-hydrolase n=1 Tax=Algimonas porphyrae TaxID=1128113 RepID=UPI0024E076C7|nr:MBL fold metallo-hydrolase [Algimonas porphyrae]
MASTLLATGCATSESAPRAYAQCDVEFVILGIGQDGGAPQIDNHEDPAWTDPSLQLLAASAALVDHRSGNRYLFEATPDMREQLHRLETEVGAAKADLPMGLSGVFLTHAHIGHYAGLIFAGHESAGAKKLPVYAMPRMADYLSTNGPWDQLVRYDNIGLVPIRDGVETRLNAYLAVTPYQVPHRDEYSETVGFVVSGPTKRILFLPDIDDWDQWDRDHGHTIEAMLAKVDTAYLDATFFDDHELPGRDMSAIPHPRVTESMSRFEGLSRAERDKIRFFHLNHTNPARYPGSDAARTIRNRGYKVAKMGERVCLD